eukprot:CAMPEP_0174904224 /NCGR_PEP_ID=MMETSP0167-20121228/47684_1 /TAXON_ID=38298 /ORGANISM="Rhodella maculata, Strain CCMP736" /LENGTH=198 /DNA_ID=CAMNT_0016146809 /DNA_START=37 /DNA_END=633 /DNA_ORIENTATION=+
MPDSNVIVDGRGHLLGRLASIVAKQLLNGQSVTIVRTEEINISGTFLRNKRKFLAFLRKRMNTNPKKGPIHFRAPSRILWRTVRGMVPHKTARGAEALGRLAVFEGVPPEFAARKRMVIPDALRVTRLRPDRKFCRLGRLSAEVGWKYAKVIEKVEAKRKVRSAAAWQKKKALIRVKAKAEANVDLSSVAPTLAAYGH